ncbi:MAG: hypothetical protein WCD31_01470 [Gillisia sp.]
MYFVIFLLFIGALIFFWSKGKNKNSDRSKGEQFNSEYASKPDAEKKESTYQKKTE